LTRVIVFAPNWLGDAVMALPAIADMQRDHPDVALDIAARSAVAPLFTLVPGTGDVVRLENRAEAASTLRARGYDRAILLTNSFNTALTARRAGAPERWGYRADFRGPLLTKAIMPPVGLHQADYYQHLTRALGFPSGPREPRLDLSDAARQRGERLLRHEGWDGRSPLLALAPGAAYGGAKRWPAASFAALARDLLSDDVTPVLIGGGGDAAAGAEVLAALNPASRVINAIARTDLTTLGGVLVNCRGLVTNDSGAMHFAAALGVNVTAIFGPTNERETYPLGRGRQVVLTKDVWCRPCMLRECPLTHRCMRGISVEAVHEAARRCM
jgi:heptosyltransferase-2